MYEDVLFDCNVSPPFVTTFHVYRSDNEWISPVTTANWIHFLIVDERRCYRTDLWKDLFDCSYSYSCKQFDLTVCAALSMYQTDALSASYFLQSTRKRVQHVFWVVVILLFCIAFNRKDLNGIINGLCRLVCFIESFIAKSVSFISLDN